MRRFIICTDESFPRGSAGANYLLYFAKALRNIGYFPIIIAYSEDAMGKKEMKQETDGITYFLVEPPKPKLLHFVTFNFTLGKLYCHVLDQLQVDENDIMWLYSAEYSLISRVKNYAKKHKVSLGACVVEWYTAYANQSFKEKWCYQRYKRVYKKELARIPNLLPISHWLDEYYKLHGNHTMVLPIMTETKGEPELILEMPIKFIYPGGKSQKDDLQMILNALALTGKDKEYELHLTGIKKSKEEFLADYSEEISTQVAPHLTLHSWLEYEELCSLYKRMDFLILLRTKSSATLANFPSKIPETMGYGIIPIVSDIGDYGEILKANLQDPLLICDHNIEECALILKRIFEFEAEEIQARKQEAHQVACNIFEYTVYERKLKDFLENLL